MHLCVSMHLKWNFSEKSYIKMWQFSVPSKTAGERTWILNVGGSLRGGGHPIVVKQAGRRVTWVEEEDLRLWVSFLSWRRYWGPQLMIWKWRNYQIWQMCLCCILFAKQQNAASKFLKKAQQSCWRHGKHTKIFMEFFLLESCKQDLLILILSNIN